MNTNRRINSFGRILKINNQTKIWYDIRNINLKRKGEFNAPKYSPAVKKETWQTRLLAYSCDYIFRIIIHFQTQ
ncbi:hypothetical protein bcgnr5378_39250 [Bacillus cereus]|nr:hypothetical protein BCM0060_4828 [Bacillus cereus]BCC14517.1 hypothetical protein BCM0074_4900 [Bacillus cereus]BCC32073.1 hypothetical protein BCM0100_4799 [Bacillus cereus]BCC49558.1 hypothetical protein BCJMU02_4867 [Bacillus cereus]BCC55653.1 hypothetical protein BCJMU07_5003 [Bacillus cereus]